MLDTSGNIISWNIGAERILGYQEAEILSAFARISRQKQLNAINAASTQESCTEGFY
jgi:PAS domain S-box-containing protein